MNRQLIATGEVLQLKDDPERGTRTKETQTLTEVEVWNGMEFGHAEYLTLYKNADFDDYGRFHRQYMLRLFCPLVVEQGLPVNLHPLTVEDLGYDTSFGIMQLTRDLIGSEKHEMMTFFHRFELALHAGKLDGSRPTVWEAWEALGKVLWGLPLALYNFLAME